MCQLGFAGNLRKVTCPAHTYHGLFTLRGDGTGTGTGNWDWHNRKQWVLIPVPVSDQHEHFYTVLYFPFGPCTGVKMQISPPCTMVPLTLYVHASHKFPVITGFLLQSHKLWGTGNLLRCMSIKVRGAKEWTGCFNMLHRSPPSSRAM